jgi:Fe-S oxidoreductase
MGKEPIKKLDKLKKYIDYCSYCPKLCRSFCPVANFSFRESLTPTSKIGGVKYLMENKLKLNEEVVDLFYQCTSCGNCTEHCEHNVEVSDILIKTRTIINEFGFTPEKFKNFADFLNMENDNLLRKFHTLVNDEYFIDEIKIVVFPGLDSIKYTPSSLKTIFPLFEKLGIDFVGAYNGDTITSGFELWYSGLEQIFIEHAKNLLKDLKNIKELIVFSPEELYTFNVLYPLFNLKTHFKTVHISQFLSDYSDEIKSKKNIDFYYHDPCYLGRKMGIYEQPRRVLSKVGNLYEFINNRNNSDCCGSCGGYFDYEPEISKKMGKKLLNEVVEQGVDNIVTTSPGCYNVLKQSSEVTNVSCLIEFIYENME